MDFLKSRQDLETWSPQDLDFLANFYGIESTDENDRLWLLAIEILSTRKYAQMRIGGKELELVDFDEYFKVIQLLGKGQYGSVKLVELKKDYKNILVGTKVAVKLMNIDKLTNKALLELNKEIGALQELSKDICNAYISCYYDHFESVINGLKYIVIVIEHIPGIDLERKIENGNLSPTAALTEKEIIIIMNNLTDALGYMHSKNIVHRDIKTANVMITPDGITKYIDFGFACFTRRYHDNECKASIRGSPAYMSPELIDIINSKVAPTGKVLFNIYKFADVWALGMLFYDMYIGDLPPEYNAAGNMAELGALITGSTPISFPRYGNIAIKDIIKGMLIKDTANRSSIDKVQAELASL